MDQSHLPLTPASVFSPKLADYVVAPTGGDFRTLTEALNSPRSMQNKTIFVKPGTYQEGIIGAIYANGSTKGNNITVIGAGYKTSLLNLANNSWAFGSTIKFINMGFIMGSGFTLAINGGDSQFEGCYFDGTAGGFFGFQGSNGTIINNIFKGSTSFQSSSVVTVNAQNIVFTGNYVALNEQNSSGNILFNGGNQMVSGNTFFSNGQTASGVGIRIGGSSDINFTGNTYQSNNNTAASIAVQLTGSRISVTGNSIYTASTAVQVSAAGTNVSIVGNSCFARLASASSLVIDLQGSNNTVVGNTLVQNNAGTGTGVNIAAATTNNIVNGNNMSSFATGIGVVATAATNVLTGNQFTSCTANITDAGLYTRTTGNNGTDANTEKHFRLMKNTSGSTINAGNVVTLKAVAAGNEVITTTTASDNQVFGVAAQAITNNSFGEIQVRGKTVLLTADGTTDIAVGDFLTTFTGAGIVRKAAIGTLGTTPGDLAIAIALEAYTTNDSLGVIDALIIEPRRL